MATWNRKMMYTILGLAWLVLVGTAGLVPVLPGADLISDIESRFPWPKIAMRAIPAFIHAILFGVMAVLVARFCGHAYPKLKPKQAVSVALGTVLVLGSLIETAQIWIPQRTFGYLDLFGDMAGAILFLALFCRRRDDAGLAPPAP